MINEDITKSIITILKEIDNIKETETNNDNEKRLTLEKIKNTINKTSTTKNDIHRVINAGFYKAPMTYKNIQIPTRDIATSDDLKHSYRDKLQISWRGIGLTNKSNFKYIDDFQDQQKIFTDEGCIDTIKTHLDTSDCDRLLSLSSLLKEYQQELTPEDCISINVLIPTEIHKYYQRLDNPVANDVSGRLYLSKYSNNYSQLYLEDLSATDYSTRKNLLNISVVREYENLEDRFARVIVNTYWKEEQDKLVSLVLEHEQRILDKTLALFNAISALFGHKLTLQQMLGNDISMFD